MSVAISVAGAQNSATSTPAAVSTGCEFVDLTAFNPIIDYFRNSLMTIQESTWKYNTDALTQMQQYFYKLYTVILSENAMLNSRMEGARRSFAYITERYSNACKELQKERMANEALRTELAALLATQPPPPPRRHLERHRAETCRGDTN